MSPALPVHYETVIRRLIRFAAVGVTIGLLLGITSTEFSKSMRIGPEPQAVQDGRVKLELPAGTLAATKHRLQLGHGHTILLLGVLPLVFACCLFLAGRLGGKEIPAGRLTLSFWCYTVGAGSAVVLLTYRGIATFLTVRGGSYDLAAVDAGLFGGSHAVRAASYGLSHLLMAVGALTLLFSLYGAVGRLGRGEVQA